MARHLWAVLVCLPLLAEANVLSPHRTTPCPSAWPHYHMEYLNSRRMANDLAPDSPTETYTYELETEEADQGYMKQETHVFSLKSHPDFDPVRGFVIVATPVNSEVCGYGSFDDNFPGVRQRPGCPNMLLNADFESKHLVSFTWQAPSCGCVKVRASVLTDVEEYYIDDDEVMNGPLTRTICPKGTMDESVEDDEDDDTLDLINNTLFPYEVYSDDDDEEEEEEMLDVTDMKFYGEEPSAEDQEDIMEGEDAMQDELELEFGVPVPEDEDEDEEEDEDDAMEPPADDDLKRRRQEWLKKNMGGNKKEWRENFQKMKKKWGQRQPEFTDEEPEVLEDTVEDVPEQAGGRKQNRQDRRNHKQQIRKEKRKESWIARREEEADEETDDVDTDARQVRKEKRKESWIARREEETDEETDDIDTEGRQGRGKGRRGGPKRHGPGPMNRRKGKGRGHRGEETDEEEETVDHSAEGLHTRRELMQMRREMAAQREADMKDDSLSAAEKRQRAMERRDKMREIMRQFKEQDAAAEEAGDDDDEPAVESSGRHHHGRPDHHGHGKRGGKHRMDPEEWVEKICEKMNNYESMMRRAPAWKKKVAWMKKCCDMEGEERNTCFKRMFQEKVDSICRLDDPLPDYMSNKKQEELLDDCCSVEGEDRLECFREKKQKHFHPKHHGKHHRKQRNGTLESVMCRRLMMPFTPGKYKKHLLKDMEADDGQMWRQLWENRRRQLAECCAQDEKETKKQCMKGVRQDRWDRVCGREEPLPHWFFSGQEEEEVLGTCCQAEGAERHACFNSTFEEKKKDMVNKKWRMYKEKMTVHMRRKTKAICLRLDGSETPKKKLMAKIEPEHHNDFTIRWSQRKEEMLQCCSVDGTERRDCLEDMRSDRYDRICDGEEPLRLRMMVNQKKMDREHPLVTKCCQFEDEERYSCFNDTITMRKWNRTYGAKHESKEKPMKGKKNDREAEGRKDMAGAQQQTRKQRGLACCNAGRPHGEAVNNKRQAWKVCSRQSKIYLTENPGRETGRMCEHAFRRCCKNSALTRDE